MLKRDEIASLHARAAVCWEEMTEDERGVCRLGMQPAWTLEPDLGGRATGWPAVSGVETVRALSCAIMDQVDQKGGGMLC